MAAARQTFLTSHFGVRKVTSVARSQQKHVLSKEKSNLIKGILSSEVISSPNIEKNCQDNLKRKPDESPEQVLKKLKKQKSNLLNKLSNEKKMQIKNKLAALPSKEILIEEMKKSSAFDKPPAEESTAKNLPAFERFHNLFVKTVTLTLPYKYKILEAMFVSMDTAVSMLHNRQEICTFTKIKSAVQEMIKRTFDLIRLGQIANVYPDAYKFAQEKCKAFSFGTDGPGSYQLVIYPILNLPENEVNECSKLNSTLLIERKKHFQIRILDIVKDHHEIFLQSLNPPILIDKKKLTNWHPQFKLDQIPDITAAELPQPPNSTSTGSTAKDVLDKAKGLYGKKIENALKNVVKKFQQSNTTTTVSKPETKKTDKLKGIPQTLLDKIRAKEMVKIQEELTRPPQECIRRAMLAKLPEIVRITRMYFIIEKKAALLIENVILKIQESLSTSLSYGEIEEHIKLLAELIPNWLILITLKKCVYVKIKKDMDLNLVIEKLKENK